jgi:hypothetical protein
MAAHFKMIDGGSGVGRIHTYRAQADLCRRLATAGHWMETRQSLEDIAASYDRLADDMDLVSESATFRSSRAAGEVQPAHRRRSRMRRQALIAVVRAS